MSSCRLNVKLTELEKLHNIRHRWTTEDVEYLQVKHTFSLEKRVQIAEIMWASSVRRQYLLKLKAKYAGIWLYNFMVFIVMSFIAIFRWTEDCQETVYTNFKRDKETKSFATGVQCLPGYCN